MTGVWYLVWWLAGWLDDLTWLSRCDLQWSLVQLAWPGLACSGLAACSDDRDDDHPGRVDKQHANSSKTGERSIDLPIYLSIYLHIYLSKWVEVGKTSSRRRWILLCRRWIWRKIIINWRFVAETCWNVRWVQGCGCCCYVWPAEIWPTLVFPWFVVNQTIILVYFFSWGLLLRWNTIEIKEIRNSPLRQRRDDLRLIVQHIFMIFLCLCTIITIIIIIIAS